MATLKIYTAYLQRGGKKVWFEPIMRATEGEAMSHARRLLATHPECDGVWGRT